MSNFPDKNIFVKYLSTLLPKEDLPLEIVSRNEFSESATFPVEIVVCKTKSGEELNLFCKYLGGMGPNNFGHRRGVEYEADIYEHILDKTTCTKIKYFGRCEIIESHETMLVLEFLGESMRMLYSEDPYVILKAASWIGNFHFVEKGNAPQFITRYDEAYYAVWPDRFRKTTSAYHDKLPWLKGIADFFEVNIPFLVKGQRTIIHGEYYPKNILLKNEIIYPVDWESTAIGPGEIDLASLVEGWDKETADLVIDSYKKARWPYGKSPDSDFEKRLLLSKIYFHFWWWDENNDNMNPDESEALMNLKSLAIEAGLV